LAILLNFELLEVNFHADQGLHDLLRHSSPAICCIGVENQRKGIKSGQLEPEIEPKFCSLWTLSCSLISRKRFRQEAETGSRGQDMRRKQSGFSLIELLIVVAIILIIAGIAIPNFMKSKLMANEASAAESLRTINTAEITYSSSYGIGFAPLLNLGGASPCVASQATACILDGVLSAGAKSGYNFTIPTPAALGTVSSPNATYTVNAIPVSAGQSGTRSYCTDQTAVVRVDVTGAVPPNPCSSGTLLPIQ
jgi:type IV pilus assembly protein PilA